MLQPDRIKNVTFEQSVFSGYKKEDVDEFLDEVYEEYSRLYKENAELVQKLKACVAKINEYRQDEQFLKSAIINAQKLNENSIKEIEAKKKDAEIAARQQADMIMTETKKEADTLLTSSKTEADTLLTTSKAEAESLLEESKIKADTILNDANEEAQRVKSESDRLMADMRESTAKEFERLQAENTRAFEAQKARYDREISAQKELLEKIKREVSDFKASVLAIYKQQTDLFVSLPDEEITDDLNENETIDPISSEISDETSAAAETVELTDTVIEPVVSPEFSDSVAAESPAVEPNLPYVSDVEEENDTSVSEEHLPAGGELPIDNMIALQDDDFDDEEETHDEAIGVPGSEDVFLMDNEVERKEDKHAIDNPNAVILHELNSDTEDTMIFSKINSADTSVVEPISEADEVKDDEMQESLFSGSPLIFPEDIPEDSPEDQAPVNIKQPAAPKYKNLKFGVDFDVKKDK